MRKNAILLLAITIVFSSLGVSTPAHAVTTTSSVANESTYTKTESNLPTYGNDINFDYASDGIVRVFFNNSSEKKMKLVVQLGDDKYIYNVFNNSDYVNYPLQLGDGTYKVSLYENTTGTKYKKIASESAYVVLEDTNNVYLQSILEIDWNDEDESMQLTNELLALALEEKKLGLTEEEQEEVVLTEEEKIQVLYDFVIETIAYDYDKIKGLDYSYLPDNDLTIEVETGICYDYSSLFASMLRSQGIPAKMAKGYANTSDVYHAWNEVYLSDEERWVVVDTTSDAYMVQHSLSYNFEKEVTSYNKVKEF